MKKLNWYFVESLHQVNACIKAGIISADDIISIILKENNDYTSYMVIYKKEVEEWIIIMGAFLIGFVCGMIMGIFVAAIIVAAGEGEDWYNYKK